MLFENKQFENGAEQTMKTLDELDKKLKLPDSGKAFDNITKAANSVNLSGIHSGLNAIQDRFSSLGIVGMTVLQNLTNSVVDMGKKLVMAVPQQIARGGWNRAMNIEKAKFQLKGFQVAWEDISKQIDYGVKDTAYGLDAAATVASQLVASSVKFTKGLDPEIDGLDEMSRALRGISGVAAMTNSSYEDIGRIFIAVAGNSRLMGDQLLQLSGRGLNAAASLVDFFNNVNDGSIKASDSVTKSIKSITGGKKVTEAELRDLVSKGKISFKVFAEAMNTAFGGHAKEANETFNGAFDNIKAALSRIGQDYATPIIQNSVRVFNALRTMFNAVRTFTKPFGDTVFTTSFSNLADTVTSKINSITDSINALVTSRPFEVFKRFLSGNNINLPSLEMDASGTNVQVLQSLLKGKGIIDWDGDGKFGELTEQAVKDFQSLTGLVATGKVDLQTWATLLDTTVEDLKLASKLDLPLLLKGSSGEQVTKLQNLLKEWKLVDWEADGIFGKNTEAAVKEFQIEIGLDPTGVVDLETWAYLLETTKEDLIQEYDSEFGTIDKIIQNITTFVGSTKEAFTAIKSVFQSIGKAIGNAWKQIFPGSAQEKLEQFTSGIGSFSEKVKTIAENVELFINSLVVDRLGKIQSFFAGLFSILSLGKQIIGGLSRGFKKLLDPLSSKIGPLADTLLTGAGSFGDWLTSLAAAAQETDFFGQKFEAAADWILNAVDNIKNAFTTAKQWAIDAWSWLSDTFSGLWDSIGPTVTSIWNHLQEFWTNLTNFFSNISKGDKVKIEFHGFRDFLSWLGENVNWDAILTVVEKIFKFVGVIVNGLLGVIDNVLGGNAEGAADSIGILSNALMTLAGVNIGTSLAAGGAAIINFIGSLSGMLASATLNWNSETFSAIGTSILMLAGSLFLISSIKEEDLNRAMSALMTLLTALTIIFKILNYTKNIPNTDGARGASSIKEALAGWMDLTSGKVAARFAQGSQAKVLTAFASSILMLSGAVWILASIDSNKIGLAVAAVVILMVALIGLFEKLQSSVSSDGMNAVKANKAISKALKSLAISILILAVSMKLIGSLDSDKMILSLLAVISLMVVMTSMVQRLAASSKDMKAVNLAAIALMLTTMASAMLKLSLSVALLSLLDSDKMAAGAIAIGALMYAITQMVISLTNATKSGGASVGQMLTMAVLIAVMSNAMTKLALSVALLSKMDQLNMWSSVGAIVVMLYAMVGALRLLGGMAEKTKDGSTGIIGMAASILILGLAMNLIAGALKKLGSMDWKQLVAGTLALIVSLYAMVGALALLNKIQKTEGAGNLAGMAMSILVLSAAMLLLAPAITMIGNIGWSAMIGVLAIAGALAVFIGAAALIDKFGLTKALLKLSGSIALFGVGVALIGVGLLAASVALTAFGGSLAAFGVAFIAFLGVVLTGIVTLAPTITMAVVSLVEAIVDAIVMSADSIVTGVGTLIVSVVKAVIQYAPVIMYGLGVLIFEVLAFLGALVPNIVDDLVKLLLIIINSFSLAIVENGKQIGEAIRNLVLSLGQFIWEALDGIFGPLIQVLFPNFYSQMTDVMNTGHGDLVTTLTENNAELRAGMEQNAESMKEGWDNVISDFDPLGDIQDTVSDASSGMSGVDMMSTGWADDMVGQFGELGDLGGGEYSTHLSGTISDGTETVSSAVNDVADSADSAKSTFKSDGSTAGGYYVDGVYNGAVARGYRAYNAGVYTANQTNAGFTNTLQIQSPSRVAMKYGAYWTEGIAIGVRKMGYMVEDAGANVGGTAIDTMRDTLLRVNDILSNGINDEITIRPVVDLSNVRAGANAISGLFGSTPIQLNSGINVPNLSHGLKMDQNAATAESTSKVELTNNFYVQRMDEGMVDYFVNRINTELGARV